MLHNDTEMLEPEWLSRLLAALHEPDVGLSGLYGVKRLRRSGRFVGRTIVHSLAHGPTVRPPWEDVAVIDAVCMCLSRELIESVGGLDEQYGFFVAYAAVSLVTSARSATATVSFHSCVLTSEEPGLPAPSTAISRKTASGMRTRPYRLSSSSSRPIAARFITGDESLTTITGDRARRASRRLP